MGILDNGIKQIEAKLSRYFLKYPQANLQKSLNKIIFAWNNTYVKKFMMTPTQARNEILDPIIRARQYPEEGLLPFSDFLRQQLKLQAKVTKPRTKPMGVITNYKQWRVGDKCLIDFSKKLHRGYDVRRGRIKTIGAILTHSKPYTFRLKDTNGQWEKGYYLPHELHYLPKKGGQKFIEERILHRFKRNRGNNKKGGKWKLVKYKDLDK